MKAILLIVVVSLGAWAQSFSDCCKSDPALILELNRVTAQRGLKWEVYCYDRAQRDSEQFFGVAWEKGAQRGAHYIEDGAKPYWIFTAPTQEGAVRKLLAGLKLAPNIPVEHRSKVTPERKRQCTAPSISGGAK